MYMMFPKSKRQLSETQVQAQPLHLLQIESCVAPSRGRCVDLVVNTLAKSLEEDRHNQKKSVMKWLS